ncbi:MAG: hypothetical protein AB4060_04040 [Crocosphaera sp.]
MMSRETWSSVSVYDFFRTCNWVGETTSIQNLDAFELIESAQFLLALNLKDFLEQSNWKGQQETQTFSEQVQLAPEYLFSLSVNSFFRGIRWKKPQEIAPMSKKYSLRPQKHNTSSDLDLNNLSDLF